eukprot:UN18321
MVFIIILGVLLIYSLLLNDVDSRTYEYGMLRSLGMKQILLVEIINWKSLSFALPGLGIGLLFAFLIIGLYPFKLQILLHYILI